MFITSRPSLREVHNELGSLPFDVQGVVPVATVHDVGICRKTFCPEDIFELPSIHTSIMVPAMALYGAVRNRLRLDRGAVTRVRDRPTDADAAENRGSGAA